MFETSGKNNNDNYFKKNNNKDRSHRSERRCFDYNLSYNFFDIEFRLRFEIFEASF